MDNKRRSWKKRLFLSVMSYHTLLHIYDELKLLRIRLFSPFINFNWEKKLSEFSKPYRLNIASGRFGKEGWINLDCFRRENIVGIFDLRKRIPFPDRTVKMIFCEHYLEHLDYYEEVPAFLDECYRVLIKDGVIRLIVPDTVSYMKAYFADNGFEVMSELRNVEGLKTKMEVVNKVFRQGTKHLFAYDQETLFLVLQNANFEVSAWSHGISQMEGLALDRPERERESIYVEGIKK